MVHASSSGEGQRRRSLKRELSLGSRTNAIVQEAVDGEAPSTSTSASTKNRRTGSSLLRSSSSALSWLLLTVCLCSSMTRVACSDDAFSYYSSSNDDANNNNNYNNYQNGAGNNNRYYSYGGGYSYNDDGNGNNYNGGYNNANNDDANNANDDANNDDANNANDDANNDDANNYNDDANANANANNDDANANANNDDDANNNNYNDYNYEAPNYDDAYNKQWEDDNIDLDVDGFDGVSIVPVSCVNFNNGQFIKFELYETENSYQCHFAQIGTFVVSIAHYMRAYFNYQALTHGNSFSLPDDVGYLNCIPLKMDKYGYGDDDDDANVDDVNANGDDANADDANDDAAEDEEDQDQKEQVMLYAKAGCLAKETFSSNTFQLHVYTDEQCTEPYDDGQTDQQHANKGYLIDLDTYYDATDDDDGNDDARDNNEIQYTDYPEDEKRTLLFSTKVSFRPNFYNCQSCKPGQISQTFNKLAGNYYDDMFISQYGMTQSAYNTYLEEKAEEEAAAQEAAECNNCQYFHYNYDDNVDDFNTNGNTDDATTNDDVQVVDDAYYNAVDDYQPNSNYAYADDANGGRRQRRTTTTTTTMTAMMTAMTTTTTRKENNAQQPSRRLGQQPSTALVLVPVQSELQKFESEFWTDFNAQLENPERSLYENQYGGVDAWNICEQLYKYGLYCDEECQSLDAFKTDQWSGADIVLLSIMCTFMGAMVMLVVGKRLRATRKARKQKSFFHANDYDASVSGIDRSSIPGLPPTAMFTMFAAVMIIIAVLASLQFVNETLVFAVVCCILLFIYMLKITLFSARKRPLLLSSPNHEDVFGYNAAADDYGRNTSRNGGFFS